MAQTVLKIAHLMAMICISMKPTPSLEKVSSYGLLSRFISMAPDRVGKRNFEPFFHLFPGNFGIKTKRNVLLSLPLRMVVRLLHVHFARTKVPYLFLRTVPN